MRRRRRNVFEGRGGHQSSDMPITQYPVASPGPAPGARVSDRDITDQLVGGKPRTKEVNDLVSRMVGGDEYTPPESPADVSWVKVESVRSDGRPDPDAIEMESIRRPRRRRKARTMSYTAEESLLTLIKQTADRIEMYRSDVEDARLRVQESEQEIAALSKTLADLNRLRETAGSAPVSV